MLKLVDRLLNRITMYRYTMYYLFFLIAMAAIFSLFGLMPFTFWQLVFSASFLLTVCYLFNMFFGWALRIPTNTESVYITSFILTLIILPAADRAGYEFLFCAGVIAIASKFIIAVNRKHIFNPAALAVVVTIYTLNQGASWWVGSKWMFVPVVLGGMLVVRKIRRWDMVFAFLASALAVTSFFAINRGTDLKLVLQSSILYSPMFFFAFVMFTEPATTPPTKRLQVIYGVLTGILFSPFVHFGNIYLTPEEALLVANIYAYIVSPKRKLALILKKKLQVGEDIYDFVFATDAKVKFNPGQYLEWTLGHNKPDLRGNRRYFTIASSPTEDEIRIGVKFYPQPSTFKKELLTLAPGSSMLAGQLAGDFTLPKNSNKKLVFIAGGIGITPYRSMLKYLLDKNEKRPITIFLSCRSEFEIVYREILSEADTKLGIKTIYTLTQDIPQDWGGERGRVSPEMIKKYVADFQDRSYYISGTHSMVTGTEKMLRAMGIPKKQIITDFFPGF